MIFDRIRENLEGKKRDVDFGQIVNTSVNQTISRTIITEGTVLMVSHELHVVMSASDRVICLNGHVCCEGTPTVVSAAPEYRALFGFGTQGALALYRHDHDHVHAGGHAHPHGHPHGHGHDHGADG